MKRLGRSSVFEMTGLGLSGVGEEVKRNRCSLLRVPERLWEERPAETNCSLKCHLLSTGLCARCWAGRCDPIVLRESDFLLSRS